MEKFFYNDIVLLICKFIDNNKQKIQFLSSCKYLDKFKDKINYYSCIAIEKVYYLWYYDRFINLKITNNVSKIYSGLKYLPSDIKKLTISNYSGDLDCIKYSKTLTHLYINGNMTSTENLKFPPNLFHLSWNIEHNAEFPTKKMPSSLKELIISNYYSEELIVPESVTSLVINEKCTVTYIKLPKNLQKLVLKKHMIITDYPSSLKELTIANYGLTNLEVPESVTSLVINENCEIGLIKYPKNLRELCINCGASSFQIIPGYIHQLTIGERCHPLLIAEDKDLFTLNISPPNRIKVLVLSNIVYINNIFPELTKIFVKKNIMKNLVSYQNKICTYSEYLKKFNIETITF